MRRLRFSRNGGISCPAAFACAAAGRQVWEERLAPFHLALPLHRYLSFACMVCMATTFIARGAHGTWRRGTLRPGFVWRTLRRYHGASYARWLPLPHTSIKLAFITAPLYHEGRAVLDRRTGVWRRATGAVLFYYIRATSWRTSCTFRSLWHTGRRSWQELRAGRRTSTAACGTPARRVSHRSTPVLRALATPAAFGGTATGGRRLTRGGSFTAARPSACRA